MEDLTLELPHDFPLGRDALEFYLRHVPIALRRLKSDSGALEWLSDPAVCAFGRDQGRILTDLARLDPQAACDPALRALRRQRGREMLRIGLRDLSGVATLEETTADLSDLADVCLRVALESRLAPLISLHGDPGTSFAILGMGKLGGRELNFCSDIDVIFLYGEEGHMPGSGSGLARHRFFNLLAERIASAFSVASPDGPLFRMDLRLRPEGTAGPLARSLEAMETYYAARGETWERMALTKARFCAGSQELVYEFLQHLQPFIYPRHIHPGVLDEIAAVKGRIEKEIVGQANLDRHIKLGRGGIREIEFVVQALQLLHGARHPFLQQANTLKTLAHLPSAGVLSSRDAEILAAAYRLFRQVEHRLQMPEEMQTHILPVDERAMEDLAHLTGHSCGAALSKEITDQRAQVRLIFERTIESAPASVELPPDLSAFGDADAAKHILDSFTALPSIGHRTSRTLKSFLTLQPTLLQRLSEAGDPDGALALFARFAERYGLLGLLFESLATNPRLLDLIIGLFDHSPFLSEVAIRRPQIIEEIARDGSLARSLDLAGHLERFRANDEGLAPLEWARIYRREAILRIALKDILGFINIEEVMAEYSAVAEAALLFCIENLLATTKDIPGIIALGKFGGRELAYGSDLDVLFIGGSPAAAAKLMRTMAAHTAEGILFPMDARLRPDGAAGPLVITTKQFLAYHATNGRADFWEKQILTKARPITSDEETLSFSNALEDVWHDACGHPELWTKLRAMLDRIAAVRAGENAPFALKTGRGGLMTAEFLVQGKLMRHRIRQPGTFAGIRLLRDTGVIPTAEADRLQSSITTLRRLELAIRRRRNEGLEMLPRDPAAQRRLARQLRLTGPAELLALAVNARNEIQTLFEHLASD